MSTQSIPVINCGWVWNLVERCHKCKGAKESSRPNSKLCRSCDHPDGGQCERCGGIGKSLTRHGLTTKQYVREREITCPDCKGTGRKK